MRRGRRGRLEEPQSGVEKIFTDWRLTLLMLMVFTGGVLIEFAYAGRVFRIW